MQRILERLLRLQDASRAERSATLWSAVTFFLVLCSYYLLRPLRERIGTDLGPDRLDDLFGATLVCVTLANPVVMALANRMPSRRFVPLAWHAFAACMVVFCVLFTGTDFHGAKDMPWDATPVLVGAGYFIWLSTFNVFATTLFWMAAVEHFDTGQGRRLFGLVGVGGTTGAVAGSLVIHQLAHLIQPEHQLLLAAGCLEAAVFCFLRMTASCRTMRQQGGGAPAGVRKEPIADAGVLEGMRRFVRSPYLWGIGLYMLLMGAMSTPIYFQQNLLVAEIVPDRAAREELFAVLNLVGQSFVLLLQLFATGRVLVFVGVGAVLLVMPFTTALGLGALALAPTITTLVMVEVLRRGAQFALDKPAREVLYTPLSLEEKHKTKAFLDTFVFRLGDWCGAKLQVSLRELDAGTSQLALGAVPIAMACATIGWLLGRRVRNHPG